MLFRSRNISKKSGLVGRLKGNLNNRKAKLLEKRKARFDQRKIRQNKRGNVIKKYKGRGSTVNKRKRFPAP